MLIAAKQANAGLRDQRAAFECMHITSTNRSSVLILRGNLGISDNIGAFGGDPGNVVALGQIASCFIFRNTRRAISESNVKSA